MVHRAKVDGWLAVLLGSLAGAETGIGLMFLLGGASEGGDGSAGSLVVGAAMLATGGLVGVVLGACYRIRYELSPAGLVVRFGPFHTRIPLDAVEEVLPSRSLLSAPAPSLSRLRINYRTSGGRLWFVLISPEDRLAFVRDLQNLVPELRAWPDNPLHLRRIAG